MSVDPAAGLVAPGLPLNRKERRRLAAQQKRPAPACSCCRPAGERPATMEDPDQAA